MTGAGNGCANDIQKRELRVNTCFIVLSYGKAGKWGSNRKGKSVDASAPSDEISIRCAKYESLGLSSPNFSRLIRSLTLVAFGGFADKSGSSRVPSVHLITDTDSKPAKHLLKDSRFAN